MLSHQSLNITSSSSQNIVSHSHTFRHVSAYVEQRKNAVLTHTDWARLGQTGSERPVKMPLGITAVPFT